MNGVDEAYRGAGEKKVIPSNIRIYRKKEIDVKRGRTGEKGANFRIRYSFCKD